MFFHEKGFKIRAKVPGKGVTFHQQTSMASSFEINCSVAGLRLQANRQIPLTGNGISLFPTSRLLLFAALSKPSPCRSLKTG